MKSALVIVSLSLGLAACQCERRPAPSTPARARERSTQATPDPSTVVVVHSWSGRTERLARELGAMLGARVVAFHDPPMPGAEAAAPLLAEALPGISLAGVHTVFLGFPVWDEAPSPQAFALVKALQLDGVRVVPFYSFIHLIRPEKLDELKTAIEAQGGTVAPAIPFLIPLGIPEAELDRRAQDALLARKDLWSPAAETLTPSCEQKNEPDGVELCLVPAGVAWVGDVGAGAPLGARAPRRVQVGAFEIARTEITVAHYAACVKAGACKSIDFSNSFCSRLLSEPGHEALPLPCAAAVAGDAYCRWAGMRLPTEAEWIRASRGDSVQAYPWGDDFASAGGPLRGNFGEKQGTGFAGFSTVALEREWPADGVKGLAPPCSFPSGNSVLGVCDLAGNIAEWVTAEGDAPVLKGGSWLDGEPSSLRVGNLAELPPVFAREMGMYVTGFRCARDVPASR